MGSRPHQSVKHGDAQHLPNLLSALRLLAAPFAAWLVVEGTILRHWRCLRQPVQSDGLDGFIARRWGVTGIRRLCWTGRGQALMLLCFAALYIVSMAPCGWWRWWWPAIGRSPAAGC
jgi:hypothetical protein